MSSSNKLLNVEFLEKIKTSIDLKLVGRLTHKMAHIICCLVMEMLWELKMIDHHLQVLVGKDEKSQKWYFRAACAEPIAQVLTPLVSDPTFWVLSRGGSRATSFCWAKSTEFGDTILVDRPPQQSPLDFLSLVTWTEVPIWTKKMLAQNSSESTQMDPRTGEIFSIISRSGPCVPIVRCF